MLFATSPDPKNLLTGPSKSIANRLLSLLFFGGRACCFQTLRIVSIQVPCGGSPSLYSRILHINWITKSGNTMVALIWVNPVEHSFGCATVHPGTLLNLCRLLLSHDEKEVHTADGHRNSHTTYFWRIESLYIYVYTKADAIMCRSL